MRGLDGTAVLIPVKAFHAAKGRLAGVLDAPSREVLARDMATNVVRAAHDLVVAVVCDDEGVAEWARSVGADVIWQPGVGLDGAVRNGVATLAASGTQRVLVAHGDLPHATDLRPLVEVAPATPTGRAGATDPETGADHVVLVPDRRHDGTNVILLPAACGFTFAYGAGSFHRHVAEAARLGLVATVVEDDALGWDVDVPDDLVAPDWALALAEEVAAVGSTGPEATS